MADLLLLVGAGLVMTGVGLVSIPAALVLAGVGCLWAAERVVRRRVR